MSEKVRFLPQVSLGGKIMQELCLYTDDCLSSYSVPFV